MRYLGAPIAVRRTVKLKSAKFKLKEMEILLMKIIVVAEDHVLTATCVAEDRCGENFLVTVDRLPLAEWRSRKMTVTSHG
jgi:hypothetical protein